MYEFFYYYSIIIITSIIIIIIINIINIKITGQISLSSKQLIKQSAGIENYLRSDKITVKSPRRIDLRRGKKKTQLGTQQPKRTNIRPFKLY